MICSWLVAKYLIMQNAIKHFGVFCVRLKLRIHRAKRDIASQSELGSTSHLFVPVSYCVTALY